MEPNEDEPSGGECGGCEYEGKMNAEGTVVCMGGTNHECTQHVYGGYFWNDQRTPCKESAVDPDIPPSIQGSDIDIDFPGSDIQDSERTPEQDSQESSGESEFENSGYGKENEYVP